MTTLLKALLVVVVVFVWFWLSMQRVNGQPPAEGAMGTLPLPAVVGMTGESQAFTLTVKKQDTYDPRWIQFYELRFQDGSAVTISGDIDVPFIQTLLKAQGKQRLTLEPMQLERIER